jgi:hypothetical protein
VYDRQLLLAGARRNEVLELSEVQRYGLDSYGDPDYVSLYGMRPADWYAKGVRLLGRTAVECTRDGLAEAIASDVAAVAASRVVSLVLDPFVGSANTLFWLLRRLPGARGLGCELDTPLFQLTTLNLAAIGSPIRVVNTDYSTGLADTTAETDELVIAFVAPPWGDALDPIAGLDLRRTTPPIREVIELLRRRFSQNPLLCAVQVYERVDPESLTELNRYFDWSTQHTYALNAPGQNHGMLLGTRGWTPSPTSRLQ